MKKIILINIIVWTAITLITPSCKPASDIDTLYDINGDNNPYTLSGTTWKIVELFDDELGSMRAPKSGGPLPENCEKCYKVTFETNSMASGKACSNVLVLDFKHNPMLYLPTEVVRYGDELLMERLIRKIKSVSLKKNTLSFFDSNKKSLFIFNKQ